ncbi:ABC transporter permease subunit [Actinomadura sp. KC345]|uniref:ABC transporter permease n=1 Tax=Actinomadura sp. KC345 TaxID=2530371 RepID=UPI00105226AA|nr:ABC transporter permease subunit [Actinomadura sp. KC345]TDC57934.1 ABC transporter permease subunit [Actinomadura sp. KC345]
MTTNAFALELPRAPVGEWFDTLVTWCTDNLGWLFDGIGSAIDASVEGLTTVLTSLQPIALAVILAIVALLISGWKLGVFTILGFALIDSMELWEDSMDSLALVIVAAVVSIVLSVPIGIAAARNDVVSRIVRPVLDFMQTMPAFVYLIPAIFFFSIGAVPGVVATVIFSMPPGVRLTELGIRGVDPEMVEAGEAFGTPPNRILTRIQIPLAMPSIMAGINQLIMLSLSMVVIAGMVGAGGLGGVVLEGINRVDVATGFEGGIAVVILAIYLDRLTGAFGNGPSLLRVLFTRGMNGRRRTTAPTPDKPADKAPAKATDPEPEPVGR